MNLKTSQLSALPTLVRSSLTTPYRPEETWRIPSNWWRCFTWGPRMSCMPGSTIHSKPSSPAGAPRGDGL